MIFKLLRLMFRALKPKPAYKPRTKPEPVRAAPKQAAKAPAPVAPVTIAPATVAPITTPEVATAPKSITGKCFVIDGDTIQIGTVRIRLAGIDAPEMEDPYGKMAKFELVKICKDQTVTAEFSFEESYDRIVATCTLEDGTDLSAEMVRRGLALDWEKFSGGKYRELEVDGARKKLWRVDAKHRGKYFVKTDSPAC